MTDETLTVKQWQQQVLATRERLRGQRQRIWPEGQVRACPVCGKRKLVGRSDLTREVEADGAVLVFANLHGATCDACGTEFLEGYEQVAIEERAGTTFRPAFSGSVTRLGGSKLGTYWSRDVAAALDLHPRDRLKITPLASDTAVLRVVHGHD